MELPNLTISLFFRKKTPSVYSWTGRWNLVLVSEYCVNTIWLWGIKRWLFLSRHVFIFVHFFSSLLNKINTSTEFIAVVPSVKSCSRILFCNLFFFIFFIYILLLYFCRQGLKVKFMCHWMVGQLVSLCQEKLEQTESTELDRLQWNHVTHC